MTIPKIELAVTKRKQRAKTILEEVIADDPESVIVFALKDGLIKTYNGGVDNRLEIIGALEAAKVLMWEDEL